MKNFKFYLLFVFLFVSALQAQSNEDEEKIIVKLSTESKLMPLYLTPSYKETPIGDPNYIAQLEKILKFDLNHNGMTFTVKPSKEADALSDASQTATGQASSWKNLNVFYVLKVIFKNNQVSARMLSVNGGSEKYVEGLTLSGNINQDRRLMHRLADMIHKALFGTEGVANTRLIYTLKTTKGNSSTAEIWEADYDGANARQITHDNSLCVTPAYIPPKPGFSSGSIMYVSYKSGQPKIYVASLKEGVGRRLSLLKGNQLMPTISRQRDKVAFICDYTGNPDLFLQAFDTEKGSIGKPQQIFATHQATQGTPTFSPDGKQVAFVSNKDGTPRIYVMDIPAPGARLKDIQATLITKSNRENTAPAWSPDGSKIAYCASNGGTRQIWVYDFDKRQERQITQGGSNKENPTWAPNSLHLIFNSTGNNESELYLINLNQPEAVKITNGSGEKRFPVWEPK